MKNISLVLTLATIVSCNGQDNKKNENKKMVEKFDFKEY